MLANLALAALLIAQPPAPPDTREADAAEAKHLKNIRQVTFGFAKAGEGYFRPDGRGIIFQAVRPAQLSVFHQPKANEDDYQIFTAELKPDATPKMVSTGKGKCTCAYYHPDGKSILFASSHLDPAIVSGKAEPSPPKGPAYSRAGANYRWDFDPSMDIFKADPDGSNLVRITDAPGYDAEGSYSPDGKQIIFTSFRDGDADIYIMDADGKNVRRITAAKGYDGGPFFSPDGKRIIYRSDRKGNDNLQVFINNVDGTAERPLTDNNTVNWGPYFHPDGRHIMYATGRHGHANYELYLMDVDTGTEERITFREGFDGLPVFSPDGRKLMWTSSGRDTDRKSQLFIADFELGPPTTAISRKTQD
jgi:TolB protein